ncbi:MAG: hypothetical protein ABL951_12230 [Alphaproteobacteria bacterium]
MKKRPGRFAMMAMLIMGISGVTFNAAQAKSPYLKGDNYNAGQFSAPGLQPTLGETIRMLIGSNVDAHHAPPGHKTGHDDAAGHGELLSYDQVQCSTYCRTVPGGLDPDSNEAFEACLGPCFKCAQISIRAQADAGSTDTGQPAFEACYARPQ